MAYVEAGRGDPIVFLHGNPASSYIWRNIMPHLAGQARVIAPDLIGIGDSDKLAGSGPDRYTFVEHREYLDELLLQLGVTGNVTLVAQDWGKRHPEATRGIVHMESIVMGQSTTEMPPSRRQYVLDFIGAKGEGRSHDDDGRDQFSG
jgi:haloalkane dehalogenase